MRQDDARSLQEAGSSERRALDFSPHSRTNALVVGCGHSGMPRRPATPFSVATTSRDGDAHEGSPRAGPALGSPRISALTQTPDPLTELPRGGRGDGGGGSSAPAGAAGWPKWIRGTLQPWPAPGGKRARALQLYRSRVAGPTSCRHPLVPAALHLQSVGPLELKEPIGCLPSNVEKPSKAMLVIGAKSAKSGALDGSEGSIACRDWLRKASPCQTLSRKPGQRVHSLPKYLSAYCVPGALRVDKKIGRWNSN